VIRTRGGDPAVQHHHLDGAADAQRAALLRSVRAQSHRGTHPRQGRRLQAQGHLDGRDPPDGLRRARAEAVINQDEARTVREIFERYLELGSVRELKNDLDQRGMVSAVKLRVDMRRVDLPLLWNAQEQAFGLR
jgi:hypothetical protein